MGKRDGRNWQTGTDIYTLLTLCIKYVASENLLHSSDNSTQCSVVTETGKKSRKEGMYAYAQLIHYAVEQKITQHCKAIIPQ